MAARWLSRSGPWLDRSARRRGEPGMNSMARVMAAIAAPIGIRLTSLPRVRPLRQAIAATKSRRVSTSSTNWAAALPVRGVHHSVAAAQATRASSTSACRDRRAAPRRFVASTSFPSSTAARISRAVATGTTIATARRENIATKGATMTTRNRANRVRSPDTATAGLTGTGKARRSIASGPFRERAHFGERRFPRVHGRKDTPGPKCA